MSKIRGETAGGSPDKSTYVVLMHDIWQSTVDELVDPAIDYFASQGYHFVDMGTCRTGTIAGCYQ